jgi:hypothetical protein
MTDPTSPDTAAAEHAASFAVGDTVDYHGAALGSLRGVVAEVRNFFDEAGHRLRAFVIGIEGAVERVTTSADALTKVDTQGQAPARKPVSPPDIAIPRSAYTDPTVAPLTDTRAAEEPGASGGGFDEPAAV